MATNDKNNKKKEVGGRKFVAGSDAAKDIIERKPRTDVTVKPPISGAQIRSAFSENPAIQLRRMQVFKWLMDGHVLDQRRMSQSELGFYLCANEHAIANDIWHIKQKLGFMFKTDERIRNEVAAVAGLLRTINMDDRGRALEEIAKIDKDIAKIRKDGNVPPPMLLQVKAQYLKIANDCARGLDKFIDLLTRAATHIHVQNANIGQNQQINNVENNTQIFSPVDAARMLQDQGFNAKIGTKKVDVIEAEYDEVEDG